jgi:hypothetical protein
MPGAANSEPRGYLAFSVVLRLLVRGGAASSSETERGCGVNFIVRVRQLPTVLRGRPDDRGLESLLRDGKGGAPRETLLLAVDLFEREGRIAGIRRHLVDLGCGEGRADELLDD